MMPHGRRWRELRVDLDLSVKQVAPQLRISPGHLTNVECQRPDATVSDRLVKRAAKFFNVPEADLVLTSGGDGVPDEPPSKEQEQETNVGPGREGGNKGRGGKDPKGPKRLRDAAA